MGLKEIIQKIMPQKEEEEELPDDVTRDKYLRSLRRQQRLLDEEEEKEYLKNEIARRMKERRQEYLWGVRKGLQRKEGIIESQRKRKVDILKQKQVLLSRNSMLNNRKQEFPRKKGQGFLSRYGGKI